MNYISRIDYDWNNEMNSIVNFHYNANNDLVQKDRLDPKSKKLEETTIYENGSKVLNISMNSSGVVIRKEPWKYDNIGREIKFCSSKKDKLVSKETWIRSQFQEIYTEESFSDCHLDHQDKIIKEYNYNRDWISEEVYEDDVLTEKTAREIEYY